jgi:hypothetical protein
VDRGEERRARLRHRRENSVDARMDDAAIKEDLS